MGNNSTRESRGQDSPNSQGRLRPASSGGTPTRPISPSGRQAVPPYEIRAGARGSRPDLSIFGIGSANNNDLPERRETKQEREARKLEKERVTRVKERERSLKEEHVDGGYLVTMGVYTGTEDFNKAVVRQLMIERRVAPFWRGLNDFKEDWTEHQLVAAGRGLPIPAADEIPEDGSTRSSSADSPHASDPNQHNLMVPTSSQSHSAASDGSATLSPQHPALLDSSSSSQINATTQSASPFKPRTRILTSLSKNPSPVDIVPREIQLPHDPHVNGQALEAYLYRDATECPICFLYYPPYLNKTRCCDQSICSECFVQIKRPDPHPPEHESNDPSHAGSPPHESSAEAEALVSEPACCPYCQLPEFGVTYEAPPFRRGLSYANPHQAAETVTSILPPSSPPNAAENPSLAPQTHKRRTTSISASASTVIATDRIRPDWATKLANARSHIARRSAAATALHTAAYLVGNGNTDTRSFGFGSRSRFSRNRGENSPVPSGSATPSQELRGPVAEQIHQMRRDPQGLGGSSRRGRMDDLEELMMIEAIKLSLEAEEERKKKVEKEAAKDAKKRAKEDKKKEKKERKGVYGSGASSAGGSTLSLSLASFGRRRGNSGGSNLARELTPEMPDDTRSKGKEADRSAAGAPAALAPVDFMQAENHVAQHGTVASRQFDEDSFLDPQESHGLPTTTAAPGIPSHQRHMSNASNAASSFTESIPNSLQNYSRVHGSPSSIPSASRTNIPGNNNGTQQVDSIVSDPMFDLRNLAAAINIGGEERAVTAPHTTQTSFDGSGARFTATKDNEAAGAPALWERRAETPTLMVTPVTPAATSESEESGKQLGTVVSGDAESVDTQ